jgi:hypothetical protein
MANLDQDPISTQEWREAAALLAEELLDGRMVDASRLEGPAQVLRESYLAKHAEEQISAFRQALECVQDLDVFLGEIDKVTARLARRPWAVGNLPWVLDCGRRIVRRPLEPKGRVKVPVLLVGDGTLVLGDLVVELVEGSGDAYQDPEYTLTTLCHPNFDASMLVAWRVASRAAERESQGLVGRWHLEAHAGGPLAVAVEGSSASLAAACAFVDALKERAPDPGIAMTGSVSLDTQGRGVLDSVDDVDVKAEGLMKLVEAGRSALSTLVVVGAHNAEDALSRLDPTNELTIVQFATKGHAFGRRGAVLRRRKDDKRLPVGGDAHVWDVQSDLTLELTNYLDDLNSSLSERGRLAGTSLPARVALTHAPRTIVVDCAFAKTRGVRVPSIEQHAIDLVAGARQAIQSRREVELPMLVRLRDVVGSTPAESVAAEVGRGRSRAFGAFVRESMRQGIAALFVVDAGIRGRAAAGDLLRTLRTTFNGRLIVRGDLVRHLPEGTECCFAGDDRRRTREDILLLQRVTPRQRVLAATLTALLGGLVVGGFTHLMRRATKAEPVDLRLRPPLVAAIAGGNGGGLQQAQVGATDGVGTNTNVMVDASSHVRAVSATKVDSPSDDAARVGSGDPVSQGPEKTQDGAAGSPKRPKKDTGTTKPPPDARSRSSSDAGADGGNADVRAEPQRGARPVVDAASDKRVAEPAPPVDVKVSCKGFWIDVSDGASLTFIRRGSRDTVELSQTMRCIRRDLGFGRLNVTEERSDGIYEGELDLTTEGKWQSCETLWQREQEPCWISFHWRRSK